MTEFSTRCVHAGLEPDPTYRSVIPPIHQTSTYVQDVPGEHVGEFGYSRSANPTRSALEMALGELEGGLACAFSSGMAAEHALITAIASAGAHVVLPDDLYGGTYRLVDKVLSRFGLEYDMVDQRDLDALAAVVRDDTALVWVETPTNPTLNIIDLPGVIERKRNALVVVDNTFATPVHQRPLELGADAVVHSTTKYLGGHSDTVGGAAIVRTRRSREGQVRPERGRRGARALRLLPRPPRSADAAPARRRARRQRPRRLELAARAGGCRRRALARLRRHGLLPPSRRRAVASSTHLFSLAESLGGVESLIEVPQAMTHMSVEDSIAAVPADLVRLSCGVEASVDLIADLAQALRRAQRLIRRGSSPSRQESMRRWSAGSPRRTVDTSLSSARNRCDGPLCGWPIASKISAIRSGR